MVRIKVWEWVYNEWLIIWLWLGFVLGLGFSVRVNIRD